MFKNSKCKEQEKFKVDAYSDIRESLNFLQRHSNWEIFNSLIDAVLLIGALVHLPHDLFSPVLSNILKALKPGGHALITMKQGQGRQEIEDGRVFYLWEKEYLFSMLKKQA